MAPKRKKDAQVEARTKALYMLIAIKPKIGSLQDTGAQNALILEVIQQRNLDVEVDSLRKSLLLAVRSHPLSPSTQTTDVFKKKAGEVFDPAYIKELNALNIALSKEKAEKPKQKPQTIKLKSTLTTSTPNTNNKKEASQADGGRSAAASEAGAPREQSVSRQHSSPSPISHPQGVDNVTDHAKVQSDAGVDAAAIARPILGDTQQDSAKFQQPIEAVSREEARNLAANIVHPTDADLTAQEAQAKPRDEGNREDHQIVEMQREEIEASHRTNRDLEVQLKLKEEENQSLKKQLEGSEAQLRAFSSKKRASDTLKMVGSNPELPTAKRVRHDTVQLQFDCRCQIQKQMKDLDRKAKDLADRYAYDRGVTTETDAEFLVHPSPEMRELYAIISRSKEGNGWMRTQDSLRNPAYETLRCLIGASIYHSVFCGNKVLNDRATGDQIFSDLTKYLLKEDDLVREAAHRRINDQNFQSGAVAQYAKQLAEELSITLNPHLSRMTAGKPLADSTEWFDDLADIFRTALIVKATADIFLEGTLEPFWSLIGSRMVPELTNIVTNDKHLPHEILFVRWPGLKMKVEGEQKDVIVSREEAATRLIKISESGA